MILNLLSGSLQDEIKEIRGLTDEQSVVLDKMGKICGFFDGLESVGGILGEVSRKLVPLCPPSSEDTHRCLMSEG